MTNRNWYKRGWGLLVAILFFPYFLVWYAWAKSGWSKNVKAGITAVVAVIMIPLSIGVATTKPPETSNQQESISTQEQTDEAQQRKLLEEQQAAQKATEEKAAAEAAEKAAAEEKAAAAAKINAETTNNSSSSSQSATPPEPTSNLPFKAICNDGSISYQDDASHTNYSGMCSGHGGIKTKLGRVP